MPDLAGARVALLEGRMESELADMVRRYGGSPVSAPALREDRIPSGDAVARFIDALTARSLPFVILFTGAGATALMREADALGRLPELLDGLERSTTICRGPKPSGVLAKYGVTVDVRVPSPHTTADVVEALALLLIDDRRVGLVHYGERNAPVLAALEERGAQVEELCLYEWRLPVDLGPLQRLIHEIIEGDIDAVAFTTQVHVRHLLQVADDLKLREPLLRALAENTTAAAIGPTCAAALEEVGIAPPVVADPPKIGPLLASLADHLAKTRRQRQRTRPS